MEDLLIREVSPGALRRFLNAVASRDDYPRHLGYLPPGATDEQAVALAKKVLEVRKATSGRGMRPGWRRPRWTG